jgi:hypothetical protein
MTRMLLVALGQTPAPPAPPELQVFPAHMVGQIVEMVVVAVIAIAITIAAVKILRPLFSAWARRLEGRGGESMLQGEIDQLRHELGDVEALRARVGELEERVDFTERLLTNQRAESQLPRGGSA